MANDLWQTPPEIYAAINQRFNFGIDLAASHDSAKCHVYITEEQNALSFAHWAGVMNSYIIDWGWLNPPYSNPRPFVETAVETQKQGKGVVMLLNNDPSVYWYKVALNSCSEVWHFTSNNELPRSESYRNGRISFVDSETGKPAWQNNKPQCVFVFDPHRIGDCQTRYIELAQFEEKGRELL